jgi:NitT/TauT family transport system ATP-binding protein
VTTVAVSVRLEGVGKVYRSRGGQLVALKDISLDVGPGEFVALVGPSGCGKSTLLMLVAGLIPPTTGSVVIGGRPINGPFTDVGIVFQRDVLLEWRTVLANVLLPAEIKGLTLATARVRARHLLERVGLLGFEDRYPYELSGGMRQRVALCRALLHDPPLLLMDEPFAALDAFTREEMGFYLLRLWQERQTTVIFVTHSIEEATVVADRIVVMSPRPGRIVRVVDVALPRPRTAAVRDHPGFQRVVHTVRELFRMHGVLVGSPEAASAAPDG